MALRTRRISRFGSKSCSQLNEKPSLGKRIELTLAPQNSFAICHGPSPAERQLMEDWIQILTAFVNDDKSYKFGTTSIAQMKVMTPEGKIEIRSDERWEELVNLGRIFAGN